MPVSAFGVGADALAARRQPPAGLASPGRADPRARAIWAQRAGSQTPLPRRPAQTPTPIVETSSTSDGAVLYPQGEPPLTDAMHVGERMNLRYVVGVLMRNRDLVRRLAAEAGVPPPGRSRRNAEQPVRRPAPPT